ncbi:fatty-acyl-CoA synthase [Branchiibius hedensis]|uniref:Fatty-acyl-CoA synthase n=1 Tax=Branchiibius hedensis TaxID=672460 RepID=A0A2Y8ZTQ6_9MICO|nr:long-chain fatty acid--CoA ligase [Branchiibius hedensis]PWJ26562.1 fatty-acyl-CoA synthase [Branchiibius hedensis]SSA35374.1 fatty-acyl-CoA synthase [Branchiibius hedensis]
MDHALGVDAGFGDWVTKHALRNPERPALISAESGEVTSYAQLEVRTDQLADALRGRGIGRGDRVAMLTLNSVAMMEIYVAVAKLGAISVPVNFRLSAPEVRYVLADSGATVLFESTSLSKLAEAACSEGTAVRERIAVPTSADRAADSEYEAFLRSGNPDRVTLPIDLDEVCVLMYTSGTTGAPKGAMLTHGNFQWNVFNGLGLGEGNNGRDVTLSSAPLFHIGALGVHTAPYLYLGACTVIQEAFTPDSWLELAERHRITNAFLVPAMWAAVLNAPSFAERDLSSLRTAVSGGAPCPIVVIEGMRARGVQFTEGFGMTETSPNASCLQPDQVLEHAGSIGKPLMHVEFRLVDEAGEDVPVGAVGELVIRGPNVMVGYWKKPEATAEAMRGGWFHSGDLGRRDEAGFYTLVDRKKDMIITGGENVYPIEVEQVMYRHPAVNEVAVIGVPDTAWGESIVAVVALTPDGQVSGPDLLAWTRERVAHFKSPKRVEFVDALPRTATGKVLKRDLREEYGGAASAVNR